MARPRKTKAQYLLEYGTVIEEMKRGTSYRKIARRYRVGISTVQRLHKKFF